MNLYGKANVRRYGATGVALQDAFVESCGPTEVTLTRRHGGFFEQALCARYVLFQEINLLAHAGAWGQERRTRSTQVAASASVELTTGARPPVWIDTGSPNTALTRCHTAQPDAIPEKWPRMTDRGAADSDLGAEKRIKAVGPSAGNMSGRFVIQEKKPIARMASAPCIAATTETALRSSMRASKPAVL